MNCKLTVQSVEHAVCSAEKGKDYVKEMCEDPADALEQCKPVCLFFNTAAISASAGFGSFSERGGFFLNLPVTVAVACVKVKNHTAGCADFVFLTAGFRSVGSVGLDGYCCRIFKNLTANGAV